MEKRIAEATARHWQELIRSNLSVELLALETSTEAAPPWGGGCKAYSAGVGEAQGVCRNASDGFCLLREREET